MSALLLRKKKNNKGEGERTDGVFPSPNTLILSCFLLYVGMMAAKGVLPIKLETNSPSTTP